MAGDPHRPARARTASSTTTTTRASRRGSPTLLRPVVADLGDPVDGESDLTGKLRGLVTGALAVLGADQPTIERCRQLYDASIAEPGSVHPELVAAATSVVAATGDADDFDRLFDAYKNASTPQDQLRHLYALAEFDDEALVLRTCELCFSDDVKTQNAPFVLRGCIANRRHGAAAWTFVRQRWDEANAAFPDNSIVRMVDSVKLLTEPSVVADVQAFFAEHPIPQAAKTLDQILERQRVNAAARAREQDAPRRRVVARIPAARRGVGTVGRCGESCSCWPPASAASCPARRSPPPCRRMASSGVDIVRAQAEAAAAEYFAAGRRRRGEPRRVRDAIRRLRRRRVLLLRGEQRRCAGRRPGDDQRLRHRRARRRRGRAPRRRRPHRPRRARWSARPRDPGARSCRSTRSADRRSSPSPTTATGAFSVQPQQGGVPVGAAVRHRSTGPWSGRYLVGLGGTISGFAITADGDWTLTVEQRSSALTFDPTAGVTGENPDVVAYDDAAPWTATVAYDGTGPIVVSAVTVSGAQQLVNQAGPFTGTIEVPAGPGFVTVDAPGSWSLQPAADG